MSIVGQLSKMVVSATSPVSYELPIAQTKMALNPFLGKIFAMRFTQQIYCQGCSKKIKKSYQDGFCFPCTQKLACCDLCILKPERCHFHLGTCREPQWGEINCMSSHVVYLANASGIKVGITRKTQVPIRWIDQGAIAALPLFEVATRKISGLVEEIIAKSISDKTNWRKMLMGVVDTIDLQKHAQTFIPMLEKEFAPIYQEFGADAIKLNEERKIYQFSYPVLEYPKKITSLSFDKTELIEGTLLGIKGQYLIFDQGVINIRKHSGYEIEMFS